MNPCQAHACSLCCHDTAMPLREADVARIAPLLAKEGLGRDAFTRVHDGWLVLKNEAGACVFLKDGACSIYELRPEGCRLYPLVYEEDAGPTMDELCPWRDEFSPGVQERRRLDALVRVLVRERAKRLEGGRPGWDSNPQDR